MKLNKPGSHIGQAVFLTVKEVRSTLFIRTAGYKRRCCDVLQAIKDCVVTHSGL